MSRPFLQIPIVRFQSVKVSIIFGRVQLTYRDVIGTGKGIGYGACGVVETRASAVDRSRHSSWAAVKLMCRIRNGAWQN